MNSLSQLLSGELKGTKTLRLSCGLKEFPPGIFELADTLEILDLSGNELSVLPNDMFKFVKMKIVFLSNNLFTAFPESLSECPQLEMIGMKANKIKQVAERAFPPLLRWLILTDNEIEELPASIGNCPRMQKLMLAGNLLRVLPSEMANCQNLELLRISSNQIEELPKWLFSLPKLSWLAYSGNPCAPTFMEEEIGEMIEWKGLDVRELLGEGASGHISRATWKGEREVAVKVFKGAVTSDGLPEHEMTACLVAGNHPHLVPVLGRLSGHPAGKQALLLELIPSSFKNLGGPPSFETCTRDTFKPGTSFSSEQVLRIAKGIASVAKHLHSKGIMHGDLYAHNILINEDDHVLLGDFGAAIQYDVGDGQIAFFLERIEVRAYGSLLDDLLLRLPIQHHKSALTVRLESLRDMCWNESIAQRPGFDWISAELNSL